MKWSISNKWLTLKSFIRQNRLIDIVHEHCFDISLANFEQKINSYFIQSEAEGLSDINCFSSDSNKFEKRKPQSFIVKSHASFSFHFF